jgi:hypothetical protein
LQAHLKASPANAIPKLLKELAKTKFSIPGLKKVGYILIIKIVE